MSTIETYDDKVVRLFLFASAVWGIIGMLVGMYLAAELAWPFWNLDIPFLTFSKLRPDHTFGVIFAFGGSALMGTCYYVVQRTGHTRLGLPRLAEFTFWGWQLICVLSMVTMPLGMTQSKEYAEPEWFIDILIAVVWVSFGTVFFATLARRRIRHIYVANWYYGAFIIAVGLLHIVNNIAIPVSLTKSYPVYSGAVDAMVQWWYGHNAVAFFLTAGFLGMMYYFVPRQAQQPLWSYRFSIVNFWALISVYMWAGSHHLMYTALPDWVQSVGMAFSLVLLMPSWGSAANGLFTFNGSWHRLKEDPAAKFMVLALVFYAAATFEGSMMAIKTVNSLSHYTDWTIAHVHRLARLGGDDHHRLAVCDGAARARASGHVFAPRHGSAFLAAPDRHLVLRHRDVDRRGDRRHDVARDQSGRRADLLLPRQPDRDPAAVHVPLVRRRADLARHVGDGVEPVVHRSRRAQADHLADSGSDSRPRTQADAGAAAGDVLMRSSMIATSVIHSNREGNTIMSTPKRPSMAALFN